MTTEQAKEILFAYRPWADNAEEPEIAGALQVVRADPELERWLKEHWARQEALRAKFRGVAAPEGLRQQILSEFSSHIPRPWWRRRAMVGALACLVTGIALASLWQSMERAEGEDLSFTGYRQRMVKMTLRAYGMDLETNDVTQVRAYLAEKRAPADFELSAALAQTPTVGCGVLSWQGKPVTMVCFRTGQSLAPGSKSDLFLFVIDRKDLQGEAGWEASAKQFTKVSEMITASWQTGEKVYVLAAFSEADLKQRL